MTPSPWVLANGRALAMDRPVVAGIVNVTPDSFYDGGRHSDAESGVAHGLELAAQGAHILDVGGESTRPGAAEVPADLEIGRVVPVIQGLLQADPSLIISVDTRKAAVAEAALNAGAVMVNDVSCGVFDPAMPDLLAGRQPGYVCMHSQGLPEHMQDNPAYGDVVDDILGFFEERLRALTAAGLPENRIALDPGIGFGKTLDHNLAILQNMERFATLGRPLYMGLSNKSLWGKLLGLDTDQRDLPTAVATALLAARGVQVHRVHNVRQAVQALAVTEALARPGDAG